MNNAKTKRNKPIKAIRRQQRRDKREQYKAASL